MYYILKNLNTWLYYWKWEWVDDPSDAKHFSYPTPQIFDCEDCEYYDIMTFIQVFRPADE